MGGGSGKRKGKGLQWGRNLTVAEGGRDRHGRGHYGRFNGAAT